MVVLSQLSAIEIMLLSDAGYQPQISTRETIVVVLSQLSVIEIMLLSDEGYLSQISTMETILVCLVTSISYRDYAVV